ncbi:MAG: DUF805 domain-containing protein [Thermoguttaceae bacterium]|nr:DUF805 domain-containing protein [Thermoguttaceae bacterium]
METNCPKCGSPVVENALYCSICGVRLDSIRTDDNPFAYSSEERFVGGSSIEIDPNAPIIPGFAEAFWICVRKKYFDFSGRASRSEFWWFVLALYLIDCAASLLCGFVYFMPFSMAHENVTQGLLALSLIRRGIKLLFAIPLMAVSARRLHDIGGSGWWQAALWCVAPFYYLLEVMNWDFVYSILLIFAMWIYLFIAAALFLCCFIRPGDVGPNRYGPAPCRRSAR